MRPNLIDRCTYVDYVLLSGCGDWCAHVDRRTSVHPRVFLDVWIYAIYMDPCVWIYAIYMDPCVLHMRHTCMHICMTHKFTRARMYVCKCYIKAHMNVDFCFDIFTRILCVDGRRG